jgi:5-(carboxyamino)imidazole ribonucleotide synthase
MVGAGQLARMTHQAAVDLDVDLVVLASSVDDSAVVGGASYRLGAASSASDLRAFAEGADVVTFDHELVPGPVIEELERLGYRVRPASGALRLAQDKFEARKVLSERGFPVPGFALASSPEEVAAFATARRWPVILKSAMGGYDGRGVHLIEGREHAEQLFCQHLGAAQRWVVEEHVEIAMELAVLVARNVSGQMVAYPVVQTVQEAGICRYVLVPAPVEGAVSEKASQLAMSIAEEIAATGILAVEMFLDRRGELVVNELALRPHNSGHVTIEACATSQFHQHLRAVLDWPLGATNLRSPAAMVNLIGEDDLAEPSLRLAHALEVPGAHVHLYGKRARPKRKLGHVTALAASVEEALETAQAAAGRLLGR